MIVGFIDAWSPGLGFTLVILGIPAASVVLLVGSIIWLVRAARMRVHVDGLNKRILLFAAAPTFLVATVFAALPVLWAGSFIGSFTRLVANRSHYESIIDRVRAAKTPVWHEEDDGVTYSTDLGPPVRVAFNPAGMLDNWSGIIYDPTGDVMLADGFDPNKGKFLAPERVTKLFGGDLVKCRRLLSDFYICSFT